METQLDPKWHQGSETLGPELRSLNTNRNVNGFIGGSYTILNRCRIRIKQGSDLIGIETKKNVTKIMSPSHLKLIEKLYMKCTGNMTAGKETNEKGRPVVSRRQFTANLHIILSETRVSCSCCKSHVRENGTLPRLPRMYNF